MTRVGIVGAGLAGVGVVHALARGDALRAAAPDALPEPPDDADDAVEVTILEKSRGVGGRAATRRRDGRAYYYDHGANYVKDADDRTVELVRALGADRVAFEDPIWPFDGDGTITPSDRDPAPKFTWETGITQFAKRLLAETDATVRKTTRVAGASFDPDRETWTVRDTDGGTHGPFDALVYTPPAPQTAQLLGETTVDGASDTAGEANDTEGANDTDGETDDTAGASDTTGGADTDGETDLTDAVASLRERVADVPFRTTRTAVLGYEEPLDRPWYALVNTDGDHAIGWLAREECKDGHVPSGESVLIVQMAPDYSERTYDDPASEVAQDAADRVARLLDEPRLADPQWTDDQGWRYAQPDATLADASELDRTARAGLFLAGDWLVPDGKGRVHEAYWQGTRVARRLARRIAGVPD